MDTITAKKDVLERLHGVLFDDKGLSIWVTSTGCTDKQDFEIRVSKGASAAMTLTMEILRLKPDLCKTTPHVIDLNFSWKELGLDPAVLAGASVRVANLFGIVR